MRFPALKSSFRHWFPLLLVIAALPSARALDPARAVKEYRVTEWGQAHGLPYPSVAAISQSADGYLWIATRAGLGRFDGVTFTTFTTANVPELGDNQIISLCAARDGTLWIGTGRGVTWYRDGQWSRPHLRPEIDEVEIVALCERPDGRMFLAHAVDRAIGRARPNTLFCYDRGQCTELKLSDGSDFPRIDRIAVTPRGDSIFSGIGIVRGQGDTFTDQTKILGTANARAQGLALAGEDTAWIGTRLSLVRWTPAETRTYSTADGLPSNSIRSLLFDHDGNLWAGTSNGLARYGHDRFEPLLMHGTEPLSNVISLFEDAETNLWIGADNGLYRVQDVKATTLGLRDGLPVNPILCVLEARDGTDWVGTIGGGIAHVTPTGVQILNQSNGLKEDSVGALAEDSEGALWIAYYTRGLSRYLHGKLTHFAPGEAVRFRGLEVDSKGTVWAASSDGVFRFAGGKFERFPLDPALEFPRALHFDRDDTLWVASGLAFGSFRDGAWTIHRKPTDRQDQPYQTFFGDSNGATWLLQDGPFVLRIKNGHMDEFEFPGLGRSSTRDANTRETSGSIFAPVSHAFP